LNWGDDTDKLFSEMAPYKEDQFPPELSFRQRDCAEPILQIADFIGGDWPQRARQALVNAFALAAFEDFYHSRQILSDLREAFAEKSNPQWISTADLLAHLHTMDDRPWDTWSKDKPMHPKALAGLLEPFGIRPRNQRTSPKTVIKGYYLEDFQKSWTRHLHQTCGTAAPGCDGGSVAAELQNSSTGISGQQLEAKSSQLIRSDVAAELQQNSDVAAKSAQSSNNETGNPARSVVAAKPTGQQIPNLTRSVVAANLHSPSKDISCQQPVVRSQQLIPGQQLGARNQKLSIGARILQLFDSGVAAQSPDFTNDPAGNFQPATTPDGALILPPDFFNPRVGE
jgi:hypothetical protein